MQSLLCFLTITIERDGWDAKDFVIQLDQSLSRSPMRYMECPCVIPKGVYIFNGKILSGAQLLLLQGFSKDVQCSMGLPDCTDAMQKDVAGNGFSLTVASAAVLALVKAWMLDPALPIQ